VTTPTSRDRFSRLVAGPDAAVDLAEASLLIAAEEYPGLDVPRYLERLDRMGRDAQERLARGPRAGVEALSAYLFEEEGFRGNVEDYYDPRNSFLNEVIDRRTGIPITLSMLYMEVARRAGVGVFGVGLPGHFLVRAEAAGRAVLVDPFHGGALLSEADCQKRLDRVFDGRLRLEPEMLAPCPRKGILARMLRNLKAIYAKADDYPRALRTMDLLLSLDPKSGEDLRDRGLLHAAFDCYGLAAADLEAYLALAPAAPEASALQVKITEMRSRAARLN
jgi:regulator of sirC expression with transglutaminase-like and TPR domain